MKRSLRILAVAFGVLLLVTAFGCKRKCVNPDEPIEPPPAPMAEEPLLKEPSLDEPVPDVPETPEGFEMSLKTIHFDFDMSEIRPGDAKALRANGNLMLKAAEQDMLPTVTLEGHCDPLGTSEYNLALGQRRAMAAKDYLVKMGVGKDKLATISYGEERLVTEEEAEFEKNRRVEFKVPTGE